MQIVEGYKGDRYIAILRNGARHIFLVRGSADLLAREIPLYRRGDDSQILARYEGVNAEALTVVNKTIPLLNKGEKINLETLLEKENQKNI